MGRSGKARPSLAKSTTKAAKQSPNTGQHAKTQQSTQGRWKSNTPSTAITTYSRPPRSWPTQIPYLSTALWSSLLDGPQRAMLHLDSLPGTSPEYLVVTPRASFLSIANPLVQIRSITDPQHPAHGQFGLFAAKTLPAGSHIVDYTGLIHACPQPSCATSDYDLAFLDRDASLAIDGSVMGNEGRFVNDYHGIREDGANAVFEEYYIKTKDARGSKDIWEARMGIWVAPSTNSSSRPEGIAKGEEICVSYGKGWWRARRALLEQQYDHTVNASKAGQDVGA